MNHFQNSHPRNARLLSLVAQPRYLRAIPSLVVLTTAMVWGGASHAGALGLGAGLQAGTGLAVAASPALGTGINAEVRSGPNSNVTDQQRMAAMGSAGADAQAGVGVDAAGAVKGGAQSAGRAAGGVRDMGEAMGGAAARTGKRPSQDMKAEVSGGLKGSASAAPHGSKGGVAGKAGAGAEAGGKASGAAATDADVGAGLKGMTPAR